MTINCVMLTKDRTNLVRQALYTLKKNTDVDWNLVLVDDYARRPVHGTDAQPNIAVVGLSPSQGILAQARNVGVYWAQHYFGRGEWLCLLDNDTYFTPCWASTMVRAMTIAEQDGYRLLGGQNHPFHHPISELVLPGIPALKVHEAYAVAGTSHFLSWQTWDKFGPQVETGAPGTGQSEDTAFCNKIREAGFRVGSVWPHVIYDCGITQSDGLKSVGWEQKERVPGVYYE